MQEVTDRPRLVSIGAVSEALGLSDGVLRKWERLGLIDPPSRIGGDNRRVYTESEVEALRLFASARRRQQQRPQPA